MALVGHQCVQLVGSAPGLVVAIDETGRRQRSRSNDDLDFIDFILPFRATMAHEHQGEDKGDDHPRDDADDDAR